MSMMPFNWNTIGGITQPHSERVCLGGFLIARGATVHPFACINGLVSENIYGNPLCFMNKTWKNKTGNQETNPTKHVFPSLDCQVKIFPIDHLEKNQNRPGTHNTRELSCLGKFEALRLQGTFFSFIYFV